jgi:hypothetical protein
MTSEVRWRCGLQSGHSGKWTTQWPPRSGAQFGDRVTVARQEGSGRTKIPVRLRGEARFLHFSGAHQAPSGVCHRRHSTMVTICTAKWSQYVPRSGHYMYRTVVTICTAQWSLYVPHSGHYMYRTVLTICTAQWPLYVPHSGHYMYRTVVTICTTSLTSNNYTFSPHSCIYVFCVDLRTNNHYFPIQHYLTGFYNLYYLCLLRGTDSVYIQIPHKLFSYCSLI